MEAFRFNPSAPSIIVPARLLGPRGVRWVDLILDTGSTSTVIDELVAQRLGYKLEAVPSVQVTTASGIAQASVIPMRQLLALGETVTDLSVLAMPLPLQLRADGLLGLDFLRRRNLFCNFSRGILLTLPFAQNFGQRCLAAACLFSAS